MASKGRITLAVPAFSLAEPHVAILGKEKARTWLSNDLRSQLFELGRSKPHRSVPAHFEGLVSVLIASAQFEREGLRDTISQLLQTVDIIALDATILRSAAHIQIEFDMSGQDAIVLASVLAHLDLHNPPESCFFNRNSKDFDKPDVRERLETRRCKFFARFEEGCDTSWLGWRLANTGSWASGPPVSTTVVLRRHFALHLRTSITISP